jgi:Cof subfamily protein (haloacid dehalogenase superfamily)
VTRQPGFDPGAVRLVATDLDGTLLHTDGTVTDRTRAVIDELDRRGVLVVFVTGRPVRWMDSLWHHVGDHGLAICSNGAVVYDVARHEVARVRPIPREVGLAAADAIRTAVPGTTFAVERTDGFGKEPVFPRGPQEDEVAELQVGELTDVFSDRVVKLLALHEELPAADYWARVEQTVGRDLTTTWSSVGALVEMSARGVTKATTLELLCAERGIAPEQVVAFGDMPNDVALLQWAGTSYAMGNAHPSVLECASRVAPRNDEDGVARVLEQLFLE